MLNAAANLLELRSPPGNRLEALKSDQAGQRRIACRQLFQVQVGPVQHVVPILYGLIDRDQSDLMLIENFR